MRQRFVNVIFSFDCFLFSVVTLGGSYPYESFSSASYRAELQGQFYGRSRKWIDRFFALFGQVDHCKATYLMCKLNLPEDMR